jgi:exosortase
MHRHTGAIVVIVAGIVWMYGGVLSSLVQQWASDDNYSHGFLILPLAAYCAWIRRDRLRAAPQQPHAGGLLLIGCSLLVFAAGILGADLYLTRISLVGVVIGSVLFVWGSAHVRELRFPLLLLPLMIPLPAVLFNQIAFPLQLVASRAGEAIIATAGIPIVREGNVLDLPNIRLAVVEACSGIRSLMSLITLAVVLAYFTERTLLARVVIVVSAVPVAIAANASRVAGTGFLAVWFGPRTADGFFHAFSGWLMFVVAFAGLVAVQGLVHRAQRWRLRPDRRVMVEDQCSVAR